MVEHNSGHEETLWSNLGYPVHNMYIGINVHIVAVISNTYCMYEHESTLRLP